MNDNADGGQATDDTRSSGRDAAMWDSVGDTWISETRQRVWRRHSDRVTGDLLRRWMRPGSGASLKTDLFDEALSAGLFPIMAERSGSVHGIDLAESTARAAQVRHRDLVVRPADVRDLPFGDGSFGTVVSTSTLDHFDRVEDIRVSLREIRRVTAPGGRLILTLDNPVNPKIALRIRLNEGWLSRTGLVPYHCGKTLAPGAARAEVEQAGFRVLATDAIVHCPRVSAVWLGRFLDRRERPGLESAFLGTLAAFEVLGRLPTRYVTGHFSAILAEACG
jgi:SAM-dependent methyltransferase